MALWTLALTCVFTLIHQSGAKEISTCPGYQAKRVVHTSSGLMAELYLDGPPCHVYGKDIDNLRLTVEYQTGKSEQVGWQTS